MKNYILLALALLLPTVFYAQAFSFKLAFEDAVGNKDTLELGFDPMATDSIDPGWGETNLIGTTPNSGLDVRVSDEWEKRANQSLPSGTFHTKKQILEKTNCSTGIHPGELMFLTFDIRTDFWPVTVSWDSIPFAEGWMTDTISYCYKLALLTDGPYNGVQFFVDGYSSLPPIGMQGSGSPYSFSSNVATASSSYPQHSYVDAQGDSVPVFWFFFNELTFYYVGIEDGLVTPRISISPNPSLGHSHLNISAVDHAISELSCFDLQGKEMPIRYANGQINISMLPKGVYFLKGVLDNGSIFHEKFIVQ